MTEDRYHSFHYLDDRHSHLRNDRFKPARANEFYGMCLRFNHCRTATRDMLEISKVYDGKWPCADVDCRGRGYNYCGSSLRDASCGWPWMEGERDPVQLHDGAILALNSATTSRKNT